MTQQIDTPSESEEVSTFSLLYTIHMIHINKTYTHTHSLTEFRENKENSKKKRNIYITSRNVREYPNMPSPMHI